MKLYRVSLTGDFGDEQAMVIWVASKREIPAARRTILDAIDGTIGTGCNPSVDELVVPTDKRGLIRFLNNYADH